MSRYDKYIKSLCDVAESLEILRCPELGSGDLDVYVRREDYPNIQSYLSGEGFTEDYCQQPFRHVWRHREPAVPVSITIDVYLEYKWSWGFTLSEGPEERPSDIVGRFMRAVFEKKSTYYFSRQYPILSPSDVFDLGGGIARIADWCWRQEKVGLLKWWLVVLGKVQIDLGTGISCLRRRLNFRIEQLIRGRGLEAAVVGVDGSGKTTLTVGLSDRSSLPIRRIYMGSGQFALPIDQWGERDQWVFRAMSFVGRHVELMIRRFRGRFAARRGYVVLYDRHPAEHRRFDRRCLANIQNLFAASYSGSVDAVVHLTGDTVDLYQRKKEHAPEKLEALKKQIVKILRWTAEETVKIDTTQARKVEVVKRADEFLIKAYERSGFVK